MTLRNLFILLFLTLTISACSRNTPEHIAQRYWDAVLTGDQQTITELVEQPSQRELSQIIQPGPNSAVNIEGAKIEGDRALVATHLQWGDENKTAHFNFETVLVDTESGWKIATAETRNAFFDSVYSSALTGLEAALNQSLDAFRNLSSDVAEEMSKELSAASEELQKQTEQANQEIQEFLKKLDSELSNELEKYSDPNQPSSK